MRTFRLTDEAFAALAAGRPNPATVEDLRRSQVSRHLLLLADGRKNFKIKTPIWYAERRAEALADPLADPLLALHTTATLAALRTGGDLPPDPVASPRHLVATHDGLSVRARLEDTDPLRARLGLTPSRRLTHAEAAHWQRLFSAAWRILVTRHRPAAEIVAAVLRVIVPIEPDPGAAGLSATSAEAFGAVALSPPADAMSFAVGLIHETQHSLLNATRTLFDLVDAGAPHTYSPWREDPRPPSGLLHGAYAYLSVARFWRAEAGPLARFEFARWRAAVAGAADALLADGVLTAAGARFVRAMRDEAGRWLSEPVDDRIERLARGANLEHRVRWRLRNLSVDVSGLVADWEAGRPARLPEPALRGGAGRALERSARLDLVHRALRERDQSLQPAGRQRPGDDAYLRGAAGAALDAYLKGLEKPDPGGAEAELWAGVALVGPWKCMRQRPEVLRDLHGYFRTVPLRLLAEWLDESLMSPPA
ncbi:HEXXH motif-containing putative peptide modification protein [Paractinoplanes rhizophilus]|uniref:HEXXH motif-containing putative peptide modification protein n=1 Tax=Paractinoplanes rhizophilus TaxID=1416877 RepID=A0ABW2I3A4_9ACTN